MIRVGVTGGMASGKSTVCRVWKEMGAYVLDADQLAKELMQEDPSLRADLIDAFGPDAFHEDGSLNRPWIAEQAFRHGQAERLDAIVHPAVRRAAASRMDEAERAGHAVGVREAALLLGGGRPDDLDLIVWVRSADDRQMERASIRDPHLDPREIRARIDRQPPDSVNSAHADFVIENDGSLSDLEQKAMECFQHILGRSD